MQMVLKALLALRNVAHRKSALKIKNINNSLYLIRAVPFYFYDDMIYRFAHARINEKIKIYFFLG